MIKLVLIRHGESQWNKENRFTGWTDVDLSEKGVKEAKEAGKILRKNNFFFDLAYTSYLKRASRTLSIILEELEIYPDIKESWKLNERHYGALQGLNKIQTIKKYGNEQVHLWRRSYDIQPPRLTKKDKRWPGDDPLYSKIKYHPQAESLKDTVKRVVPYYRSNIAKNLLYGRKIIISAHGNSLRALVKYIEDISDDDISALEIPTGKPLVYELDKNLRAKKHYYLK